MTLVGVLTMVSEDITRSPLRWIGGKSGLVRSLLSLLPQNMERLVEPMVGSGALFFGARPRRALLADINGDLINFLRTLTSNTDELIDRLLSLRASKRTYYSMRSLSPSEQLGQAARFAYLNRLSWNGVYRVNGQGKFNVPMGDRLPAILWTERHLAECARLLKAATLVHGDFEDTVRQVDKGDLVYFDPPYPKQRSRWSGFNRYSPTPFDDDDFKRLTRVIRDLHERNISIMVSSSIEDPHLDSYPDFLVPEKIATHSLIAAKPTGRGRTTEIVLRNYGGGVSNGH